MNLYTAKVFLGVQNGGPRWVYIVAGSYADAELKLTGQLKQAFSIDFVTIHVIKYISDTVYT